MSKHAPAFPLVRHAGDIYDEGMALRDYFAIHASDLDVNVALHAMGVYPITNASKQQVAAARYAFADEMILAGRKP